MKKYILLFVMVLFVLTGCSKKEDLLRCRRESSVRNEKAENVVYYTGDIPNIVIESVTFDISEEDEDSVVNDLKEVEKTFDSIEGVNMTYAVNGTLVKYEIEIKELNALNDAMLYSYGFSNTDSEKFTINQVKENYESQEYICNFE